VPGLKAGWEGRFLEDFEVGDVYRHPGGRTVTEADNIWFTLLTMNTHPAHFDAEYGRHSEYGRCLVNSALTLAIVLGMSVSDVSLNAVANLGWDEVRLPAPVFAGDTLYAESEVLEVRGSKSRPNSGIVTVRTRGLNQDGGLIIVYKRSVLVYRRGAAPRTRVFPEAQDGKSTLEDHR
jgi:acyl dehydratase